MKDFTWADGPIKTRAGVDVIDSQYSDKDLLNAFMKTAQYLASLIAHEDVWNHVAKLIVKFYNADSAGFATRSPGGEIELHHTVKCGRRCSFPSSEEFKENIQEVFETGFLSWRSVNTAGVPCTVFFLPVTAGNETFAVMIVGHVFAQKISNDLLNVYLAIAGLAGATIKRLISETELKKHRVHLEMLVSDRTKKLTMTLKRLELEISEHMRAEGELRTIRDHLEELVEKRTAELEKVNRELTAYSTRLELVNSELQEFAFVASHDLQEPLRKIQTFCDMAQQRCAAALDPTSSDYMDRIITSANRMRQLLRDLLEFSRVATRLEPFKKIDLSILAREAADVFEASIKETDCRIEIETMPAIEADESQMLRLFQNLIGNALKFRSETNSRINVSGKSTAGGTCEIIVKDNGIGFDQQFAELIFKPFQRLCTRSEYEGTGMGLSICRKIVERHGGTIRAQSEPGKGSKFIIRLPVKQNKIQAVSEGESF